MNRRGFIDHKRKGVVVGEEENRLSFSRSALVLARSLCSPMFSKRKVKQRLCAGYHTVYRDDKPGHPVSFCNHLYLFKKKRSLYYCENGTEYNACKGKILRQFEI